MMDFQEYADRLTREQSKEKKIRGSKKVAVSQKAKRQAEYERKQQAKLRAERERKKRLEEHQKHYWNECNRKLKVKPLSKTGALTLKATSIHGEGDKITLPPSVLQILTQEENNLGNPWTFRIGIPNPDYTFPTSALIHTLKPPDQDDDDGMSVDSEDEDNDDGEAAYMDELSYKYLAYTNCTVVEFTQEEGHVGIPQPIASALLNQPNKNFDSSKIPLTRTVDPALVSSNSENNDETNLVTSEASQTPGHVAYGAFDIPDMPLEITMLKLPKGRGCTLVPTETAVQNNFYGLKDVKLVLEQSLIRTRATLSIGDVVSTWHRGVKFDLNVTKVIPSRWGAVTCINTDIEVEIGEIEQPQEQESTSQTKQTNFSNEISGRRLGTGQTLSSSSTTTTVAENSGTSMTTTTKVLLPEPPQAQKENICVALIRHSGGHGKRRFDIQKSDVNDLLAFAASLVGKDESSFQLVTRMPRRVFSKQGNASSTLAEANIQTGQETFMLEIL